MRNPFEDFVFSFERPEQFADRSRRRRPLTDRRPHPMIRRFVAVESTDDVWDFGRPNCPRTFADYAAELRTDKGWSTVADINHQRAAREQHARYKGSSLVTLELVDLLADLCQGKVVEPFAGQGWLSAHLQARGIDVTAIDNGKQPVTRTWTRIHNLDVVAECSDANVIIMQNPPNHVVAQQVVMKMQPHEMLLFYGSDETTGDGKRMPTAGFWHHLSRSDPDYGLSKKLNAAQPHWAGSNSRWRVYYKR